ncbi:MAG: phosphatase PAP2 family protein [Ruminococcus sp.]|nr:phosphatase PAP2 family protein [Ruminococcus sp.]
MKFITEWDLLVLEAVGDMRNPVLTFILRIFTHLADAGIFWIFVCLMLILYPRTRRIGIFAAVALAAQVLLGEVLIKHIVCRERPFFYVPSIDTIINHPTSYSFPSGHTSASFAVSLSVLFQNRKLGLPLLVAAFLIGFSRMYFMVHYPTDVICGMLLGTLTAIAVFFILGYLSKKHSIKYLE